ncbi:Ribosomal large subunit pseudouridine synthase C [uncultured Clostridium sp.]|jgi:23S rRNA pseudouridine955/2504/2580 synthase|nr:Ribosomal large subunit pseudouridine synthase C [uncultured Clostridium sp.]
MTLVIEMKKIVIKENDANQRIDKYLKKLLCNAPSNFIYKMFRKKDIKINGKKVNEKYILQKDDILEMFLYDDKFNEFTKEKDIYDLKREFKVLYEDQNILIVDKPVGLLVHGDAKENVNTLSHQVLSYLKEKGELDVGRESTFTPGPVHRLDRNTSGIVIFGKTLAALQDLNEMMKKRHHIEKSYMTICKGKLTKQQELVGYVKKIDNEDRVRFVKKDDKDALMMKTIVKPIRTTNDFSLVEVKIITGRMHQIRIHLSSIDHPVIGDRKYGDFVLNKQMKQQFGLNNQLLHAYKINFVDPFGSLSYLKGKKIICPKPTQFKKIEKSLFESVL